jgi:hypothetical protein
MSAFSVTGGCHCGAVRYRVTAPAGEVCHYHCSICRRVHGAAFASFAIVAPGDFTITRGVEQLSRYDSTPGVQRYFCTHCGAQIYGDVDSLPDIRFYTIGTLDGGAHPGHRPENERHIYVGSKMPWWHIADGLPQHDAF